MKRQFKVFVAPLIDGTCELQMCKCESPVEEKENTLLHPAPQTGVCILTGTQGKTERPEQPDYIWKLEYKWTFGPKRLLTLPNIAHYESSSVENSTVLPKEKRNIDRHQRLPLCTVAVANSVACLTAVTG